MRNFDFLESAIGLVLVDLLVSLLATAAFEIVERFARMRSKELEAAIRELITDGTTLRAFYEHPQIYPLFRGGAPAGTSSHPAWRSRLSGSSPPRHRRRTTRTTPSWGPPQRPPRRSGYRRWRWSRRC